MPTHHRDQRRGGDLGEQLARELRRRARTPPPPRPLARREHYRALGLAVLIVLAFFGLVFLAAVAATIIDPTAGGWTP